MARRSSGIPLSLLFIALAAAGCDAGAPQAPEHLAGETVPVIVSNPVRSAIALEGSVAEHLAASGGANGFVAYVSMEPGTVPGGLSAEIVNARAAATLVVSLVDGGFDPAPIAAIEGDTLAISLRLPSGRLLAARAAVPARRRPRVVRTYPARGRRDIAINAVIGVTFSEPIERSTLTDSTLRLMDGTTAVPGTIRFPAGPVVSAEFVPAALEPGTEYRLELDERIRDRTGDPLEPTDPIRFGTSAGSGVGALAVTVRTSGQDPDPDGYNISLDGRPDRVLAPDDSVLVPGLAVGRHGVMLDWVGDNCVVAGGVYREVVIAPGQVVSARFEVSCMALPSLTVTVRTSGADPDTDGYDVMLDGALVGTIPASGTATFPGFRFGTRWIGLAAVRANCVARTQQIDVPPGVAASVEFDVECTPDFVPSGVVAFVEGNGANGSAIYVADVDGSNRRRVTAGAGWVRAPAWSADGSRLAFVREEIPGAAQIWTVNADGTNEALRAAGGFRNDEPAWSPDGTRLAFSSDRDGPVLIYVMDADGDPASAVRVGLDAGWASDPAWSPTGTEIAFIGAPPEGPALPYIMNADGSAVRPLDENAGGVVQLDWLPDGRIALTRVLFDALDPSGEVVQVDLVATDGSVTSTRLDAWPGSVAWAANGEAFAYSAPNSWYLCVQCADIRYVRPGGQRSSVTIPRAYDLAWKP